MELVRKVTGDGPEDARIVILTDVPEWDDASSKRLLTGFAGRMLLEQFRRAGIFRSEIRVEAICEDIPPGRKFYALQNFERELWKFDALRRLKQFRPNVIVPLGEDALQLITDKKGIDKWHCSIIKAQDGTKCVPLLHPDRVNRVFSELYWLTLGATRIFEEAQSPAFSSVPRSYLIAPPLPEAFQFLDRCTNSDFLSVDIETGRGQITCVGFAPNPTEAMSIPTLPQDYPNPSDFHALWKKIAEVLAGPSRKVFQNGIYDTSYFSRYGIRVNNFWFDTMVAQKFLFPEFEMGLDVIARMHTREPYWKDDAKDWGIKQDRNLLFTYNCTDAAVTLEAAFAQRTCLEKRGLSKVFFDYIMKLTGPVSEMCWRGLPVDVAERERLHGEAQKQAAYLAEVLNAESLKVLGRPTNARSPKQVKELLSASKIRLPIKDGKETTDKGALMGLRLKYPDSKILTPLILISEQNKDISSFLEYKFDADERVRYSIMLHGTETGRFSCYKDPFDHGLNAQTIPSNLKSQFACREGFSLIEVDLKQADGRFVAWDANEPELIRMYSEGIDIHRFVASQPELIGKPMEQITKVERQLGKKAGHAANYGVQENTLALSCLKEMNLVLSPTKAASMLRGYHRLFPGIKMWQQRIENELRTTRKLTTPFGRERNFYDRVDENMFRQGYAYRPQSTVADVINQLVLHMFGVFPILLQIHDSALFEVSDASISSALKRIQDQEAWNPKIPLSGGDLRIPIEIKVGRRWSEMKEVFSG